MTANATYKLEVVVQAPKEAVVGKTAKYAYKVKNLGSATFDGFIQIMLSWSQLNQNVYQPLNIQNLAPKSEATIPYSQAPLMSGYTWFTVVGAVATKGGQVEVLNEGGNKLYPFPIYGNQPLIQPLFAMRSKSPEEKELRNAFFVAVASLAVIAIFQVIDWLIRFTLHT